MADEDRALIAEYVLSGNMREADTKALTLAPSRQAELRARLGNFREGGATVIPEPNAEPGDFRAAIAAREDEIAEEDKTGKPTPRWNQDKQPMKAIYIVNDGVSKLPTPAGLGMLLLGILALFFILIPATSDGETRALLLWEVLLGKKQINDPSGLPGVDAGSGTVFPAFPELPGGGPVSPPKSTILPPVTTSTSFSDVGGGLTL